MDAIKRYFDLEAKRTTVRTELLAGLATFLTMAYIIVVNPDILSKGGMDFGAVFVATVLAAAIGTLIMGLWANWPVALAPGMGLNAYFTFSVILGLNQTWEVALGAVFLGGVLVLILSLTGLREWIINSIPKSLKLGIGAGIGFFLAIIGLTGAGMVVDSPATLVGIGNMADPKVLLAGLGFCAMVIFTRLGVPGSIVISILAVSIVAWITGLAEFHGIFGPIPSIAPTFMKLDIAGAFTMGMIGVVFAFMFVDFFDTAGTLTSVANVADKVDAEGKIEGIGKAIIADSSATIVGTLLGTSNTTSYVESGAGISEGGRTGLTAVAVAGLFLLCLFLSPLAMSIPAFATAPALVFVAAYFARNLRDLDWEDVTEYAPAILAAVLMPLTYSIANGIAIGFISYTFIKILAGKWGEINWAVILVAVLGVLHYAYG
jgi:AGZA family xanthine/uracil permease-like MFS transporter